MYFDKNINTNLRALAFSKGTVQFWILAAKDAYSCDYCQVIPKL